MRGARLPLAGLTPQLVDVEIGFAAEHTVILGSAGTVVDTGLDTVLAGHYRQP